MMATRKSICFVGSDNYPVLDPEFGLSYVGGESVQQTLLAKAFTKYNYDVSMVVIDHGQVDGNVIDNIKVWKTYKKNEGIPVLRFVYPRITKLWKALLKADADIYYQSCAGAQTGIVAYFCQKHNRKLVFRIAHDTDCIPGEELIVYTRDKKLYQYGIKKADLIVSQSDQQKILLHNNYHVNSPVINMAVETPENTELEKDIDVLWVNNIREFKQPLKMIELAKRNPNLNFVMIGGECEGSQDLYKQVCDESAKLENLDYKGFVPYHEVNFFYQRAKLFVNTSDTEGFPNSFLQSWIRRTPVISFFDPDNTIVREKVGESPNTIDEMSEILNRLIKGGDEYQIMAENAYKFAHENYAAESVVAEYIEFFKQNGLIEAM